MAKRYTFFPDPFGVMRLSIELDPYKEHIEKVTNEEYVLATDHDAELAEKDREIERLKDIIMAGSKGMGFDEVEMALGESEKDVDRLETENDQLRVKLRRMTYALSRARDPHAAKWRLAVIDEALSDTPPTDPFAHLTESDMQEYGRLIDEENVADERDELLRRAAEIMRDAQAIYGEGVPDATWLADYGRSGTNLTEQTGIIPEDANASCIWIPNDHGGFDTECGYAKIGKAIEEWYCPKCKHPIAIEIKEASDETHTAQDT